MRLLIVSLLALALSARPAAADPVEVAGTPVHARAALEALEDARDPSAPGLQTAATDPDPTVRARAALAFGRILDPALVDPLLVLLDDADPGVRRQAAWSLGQFGFLPAPCGREAEIALRLRPLLRDPSALLRATAAEALGKVAGPDAPALATPALDDPAPSVRAEAALACFRWRQALRMQGRTGDLPALPGRALDALLALTADADPEVRWRAIYAFARVPDYRAIGTLAARITDPHPWARLFAIRGLTVVKAASTAPAIAAAAHDAEHAVRLEAVSALVTLGRVDLVPAAAAQDPSWAVRAAAAAAGRPDLLDALDLDPSPVVRAAVLAARAKADPNAARDRMTAALRDSHWVLREAAVAAAAALGADALPLLESARADVDERVRAAAIEAAGGIPDPRAFALIRSALAADGLAERGTAVDVLTRRAEPEAWDLLVRTYDACLDHRWNEVRESIADGVKESKADGAVEFLRRIASADPAPAVRAKAIAALKSRRQDAPAEGPRPPLTHSPHQTLRFPKNPRVVLETPRGRIVLECFAQDAPVHTANFVGLIRAGTYDGLDFHRVVSNFVIQGGDPQRTGWGDAGWALRAEINERRYERGALGMPRSAGFDTGGCQIFVTHIPTPHLDGLYTVFGRVVEGFEVVDRIERGDRIERARVEE